MKKTEKKLKTKKNKNFGKKLKNLIFQFFSQFFKIWGLLTCIIYFTLEDCI